MFLEQSPAYRGAANGLAASYAVNFTIDVDHFIPLTAIFQGDQVFGKTLYVDNYSSQYAITISNGAISAKVPAFSTANIDIRGFDFIQVTAESSAAGTVNMSVKNYIDQYGSQTRTFQSGGLTSDPYFASVKGLYHFNGNNGATFAPDTSPSGGYGLINVSSLGSITTADSVFGGASLSLVNSSSGSSPNLNTILEPHTTEFWIKRTNAGSGGIAGILYSSFQIKMTAAGVIQAVMPNGGSMGATALTLNAWTHVAYVNLISYQLLFVQGALAGTIAGVSGAISNSALTINSGGLLISNSILIDELRITNAARYTSNFTVPTAQFFDN